MIQRSPPNRRDRMVNEALTIAASPYHGYSQRPPSGRWGPDFDCSSLIYTIANKAGYPIEIGGKKVRFTGTMLEDFKKAGFQILPFANVSVNDLKIGDILLNLALHAEICVGEGQTVGALSSETGAYVGESGDQTGHEISRHPILTFDKGWDYVLRPPETQEDGGEPEMGDYESEEKSLEDKGGDNMAIQGPMNSGGWYDPNRQPYDMSSGYPQYGGYPQGTTAQMNGYSQARAGYPSMGSGANQQRGMSPAPMPSQMPNQIMPPQSGGYQNYQQNPNPGYQQGYPQAHPQAQPQAQPQGYPQGSATQLPAVCGMEGARDYQAAPGTVTTMTDASKPDILYVKTTDQNGYPSIRVFKECSEDMPQHYGMHNDSSQDMMRQVAMMREELDQLKEMLNHDEQSISSSNAQSRNGQSTNGQPGNQPARRG